MFSQNYFALYFHQHVKQQIRLMMRKYRNTAHLLKKSGNLRIFCCFYMCDSERKNGRNAENEFTNFEKTDHSEKKIVNILL